MKLLALVKLRQPGRQNYDFDIFTYGADGQEGGEDENADIGNW
ncbi:MAG: type II secretion system protein GspG [Cyanobacteriota bacterium]|nr:type II secretion system protein GspG [Cyanobacteriota bacterium]